RRNLTESDSLSFYLLFIVNMCRFYKFVFSVSAIFVCVFINLAKCNSDGEYYWRPWTSGAPPSDAIFERDYKGRSYVVEAYAPNLGLFIGQALQNQHLVNVSALNPNTTQVIRGSQNLRVLCSKNKDQLIWYPTNYLTIQNELLTGMIQPVIGGYNSAEDVLYIGRYIDYSTRSIYFGTVFTNSRLYFYNNGLRSSLNFDVLVLDRKCKAE
ncbi:hypothetical protein NQ317_011358, partial [Molorchus minor]